MKIKFLLCLSSLGFLAPACSTSTLIPATATTLATATPTHALTPLTSTLEPSPTIEPNMPEGATGKNDKGEWIKTVTENGKPVEYAWNTELNGWFTSHVLESPDNLDGGIPVVESSQDAPKRVPLFMRVMEGVSGVPFLRHVHIEPPEDMGKTLSDAIYNELYDNRFEQSMSRTEFSQALTDGSISVPFTTPDGKTYVWKPGPHIGYKFYAIPWDDADPTTYPAFFETPERSQFGDAVYRWTVYVKDGIFVVKGAVQDPASLTDDEVLAWILNPMGTVIEFEKLPKQDKGWVLGDKSDYVKAATTRPSHPFFEIVRNQ